MGLQSLLITEPGLYASLPHASLFPSSQGNSSCQEKKVGGGNVSFQHKLDTIPLLRVSGGWEMPFILQLTADRNFSVWSYF